MSSISSSYFTRLQHSGLTNTTTGEISEYTMVKKKYVGECKHFIGERPCNFVTRNKLIDFCPLCSHAIVWSKEKID